MSNIFDYNFKNNLTLFGESSIINISETIENTSQTWDFKNECPYCEILETSNALSLKGIKWFDNYFKIRDYEKEYLWLIVEIKLGLTDLETRGIHTLNNNDFELFKVSKTSDVYGFMKGLKRRCFIIGLNKEALRKKYKTSNITKKVIEKEENEILKLAKKAIWRHKGLAFELKYFKINKKNLELIKIDKIFYGPNLKENGIQNFLKENYNENNFKVLTTKNIPNTKTYLEKFWKNFFITPKIIEETIPEIKINDLKEIIELEYETETELFSKYDFSIELLYFEQGKLGKLLKNFIKKRINDSLKEVSL